jgi:hypothetical protein
MKISEWLHLFDWDIMQGLISLLSVFITAYLTYRIINQTAKLNKQQEELQKRQISVDLFSYRRDIYQNLYKILECSEKLLELHNSIDFSKKSIKELTGIFSITIEKYVGNEREVFLSLIESEYILDKNMSGSVLTINQAFDDICFKYQMLETLEDIATEIEVENYKKENLKDILSNLEFITGEIGFIQSIYPKIIDISMLDK